MVQELQEERQRSVTTGSDAWRILGALFLCGSVLGPPLDGIHTNVGLIQYDSLPLELGALALPHRSTAMHHHRYKTRPQYGHCVCWQLQAQPRACVPCGHML